MIPFEITILGNNSAIPAHGRHPSAQFIKVGSSNLLIDCGEGTQNRINQHPNTKMFGLDGIFISHLHGDHFLGLMPLLSSLGLMRREKPLQIFGHAPLLDVIETTMASMQIELHYDLQFYELPLQGSKIIFQNKQVQITAFQLDHRIPCCGFLVEEKFHQKKLNFAQVETYKVPKSDWNAIQKGADFETTDGRTVPNKVLTIENPKPRSYAYCSDTKYTTSFVDQIYRIDTAYIETTYTENEKNLAAERYHCTAKQAATIAKDANVGRLLIGHFSSRYRDLNPFLTEARDVFLKTELALEGETFRIESW